RPPRIWKPRLLVDTMHIQELLLPKLCVGTPSATLGVGLRRRSSVGRHGNERLNSGIISGVGIRPMRPIADVPSLDRVLVDGPELLPQHLLILDGLWMASFLT